MIKTSQMSILNWFKQTIEQTNKFSKISSIIKNVLHGNFQNKLVRIFFIIVLFKLKEKYYTLTEAYSKPSQTYQMECFVKTC